MNKRGQLDELNPISIAAGVIGGVAVLIIMGNTGEVKVGLIWKILGFIGGVAGGYFVFDRIMNK